MGNSEKEQSKETGHPSIFGKTRKNFNPVTAKKKLFADTSGVGAGRGSASRGSELCAFEQNERAASKSWCSWVGQAANGFGVAWLGEASRGTLPLKLIS